MLQYYRNERASLAPITQAAYTLQFTNINNSVVRCFADSEHAQIIRSVLRG
jgi:hypothetical protein